MKQRRAMVPLLALALTAGLAGCGSAQEDATTAAAGEEPGVRVVSPTDAAALLDADPAPTLIDVRTPAEFDQGHLEGAELVDFNAPDVRDRIAEFDPSGDYVIYCRSGNRSAGAREIMTELGFEDVADIDGGIAAWNGAGLPVTTG